MTGWISKVSLKEERNLNWSLMLGRPKTLSTEHTLVKPAEKQDGLNLWILWKFPCNQHDEDHKDREHVTGEEDLINPIPIGTSETRFRSSAELIMMPNAKDLHLGGILCLKEHLVFTKDSSFSSTPNIFIVCSTERSRSQKRHMIWSCEIRENHEEQVAARPIAQIESVGWLEVCF